MSSVDIKRIKQIRKKEINGFGAPVPLGTDGLLVDMLSGLDLEEELKLGNNHSATITQIDNNTTQIKEQYYDKNKRVKFSVSILIAENDNEKKTIITMTLYNGAISSGSILHTKTTIIDESNSTITQVDQEVDKG